MAEEPTGLTNWMTEVPLKFLYPNFLLLCSSPNGLVSKFMVLRDNSVSWNLQFRRNPQELEIEKLGQLLFTLDKWKVTDDEDSVHWMPVNSGTCYVKALRPS